MSSRTLTPVLRERARHYPVVTVTGPRQSGKTTLCRAVFGELAYVSLEPLDVRDEVRSDPRGFLEEYREGAVIDEVQHVPELLSYLQAEVDSDPRPGRFVVTDSQAHRGVPPRLFHYREARGLEVDIVAETGARLSAVEAKSGATVATDFLRPLSRFLPEAENLRRILVFGGEEARRRGEIRVVPWRKVQEVGWV